MDPNQVLLVAGADRVRVGVVLAMKPLTVRWEDTGEEQLLTEVPKGAEIASTDSLRYRSAVDRAGVEAALANPLTAPDIVVALLADQGRALTLKEIKIELRDGLGLSQECIDAGTKRLVGDLTHRQDINTTTESVEAPAPSQNPDSAPARARSRKGHKGVTETVVRFAWAGSNPRPIALPALAPPNVVNVESADSVEKSPLASSILSGAPSESLNIAQVPPDGILAALAQMDEQAVADLAEQLVAAGRYDVVGVLFAAAKAPKAVARLVREWPSDAAKQRNLAASLDWALGCLEPAASKKLLRLASERSGGVNESVLAVCMTALLARDESLRDPLLAVVGKASGPVVEDALAEQDVDSLLRVTRSAPLTSRGRLLWAAWRLDPRSIAKRDLWPSPVKLDDLVSLAGQGSDGRILEDDWVRDVIARPAVELAVGRVERRDALAKVLALPGVLFDLVSVDALAAALSRAATSDTNLSEVQAQLARSRELQQLSEDLAQSRRLAESALAEAEAARFDAAQAREAEARSFQRTAQAEREQLAAAHRELRQERIDALKGLVAGMSAVSRLHDGASSKDALSALARVAEGFSLRVIGVQGELVTYDPTRHELLGGIEAAKVVIMEPGFEYSDDEGSSVLSRAAVVRPPS